MCMLIINPTVEKFNIGLATLVISNTASNAKHSPLQFFFFLSDKKLSRHRTLVSSCLYQAISVKCKDMMLRFPNASMIAIEQKDEKKDTLFFQTKESHANDL